MEEVDGTFGPEDDDELDGELNECHDGDGEPSASKALKRKAK